LSKTLAIIASGTSLNQLPRDFVFPDGMDTMTLNTAAIAPQFYDMKTDKWHKSWTYSMFIDSEFEKKYYFPECYAFQQAVKNTEGTTYLLKGNFHQAYGSNIQWITSKVAGGSVLCPALLEAHRLGYKRIVLFGCDYCRRQEKDSGGEGEGEGEDEGERKMGWHCYWWEIDPDYYTHPKNNTLISAGSDGYKEEVNGKVTITLRKSPPNWRQIDKIQAPNGEMVLSENTYTNQMAASGEIMDRLRGEGVEIFKYSDAGLLDIPIWDGVQLI